MRQLVSFSTTFAWQLKTPNANATRLAMCILAATQVLSVSCSDFVISSSANNAVPGDVVERLLLEIQQPGKFPIKEAEAARLLPTSEQVSVNRIEQGVDHDLQWISRDGSCYVTFMVEDQVVSHIWGRCSLTNGDAARRLVRQWMRALPSEEQRFPTDNEPFVHSFTRANSDIAVDFSLEREGKGWLVGFGLRSGVPHDS